MRARHDMVCDFFAHVQADPCRRFAKWERRAKGECPIDCETKFLPEIPSRAGWTHPVKRVREGRLIDTAAERLRNKRASVAVRKRDGEYVERWRRSRRNRENGMKREKSCGDGGKYKQMEVEAKLFGLLQGKCSRGALPAATPDPE